MLALSLVLSAAAEAPQTYDLDAGESWLYVKVYNDRSGLASRLGHDHAIRATTFDGEVTWSPEDPTACRVRIEVPVDALRPDTPGLRDRAGLDPDGTVGESQLQTIRSNFLGKSQLHSTMFPTITFEASTCDAATGEVTVDGMMTMRGVEQPVSVTLDIDVSATAFSARGTWTTTTGAFGFDPFRALGGALRNQDRLDFVIDVRGPAR